MWVDCGNLDGVISQISCFNAHTGKSINSRTSATIFCVSNESPWYCQIGVNEDNKDETTFASLTIYNEKYWYMQTISGLKNFSTENERSVTRYETTICSILYKECPRVPDLYCAPRNLCGAVFILITLSQITLKVENATFFRCYSLLNRLPDSQETASEKWDQGNHQTYQMPNESDGFQICSFHVHLIMKDRIKVFQESYLHDTGNDKREL